MLFDCSETGYQTKIFTVDESLGSYMGIPIATKVFENSDAELTVISLDQNYNSKISKLKDVKIYPWLASIMNKAVPATFIDSENYTHIAWQAILSTLQDIHGNSGSQNSDCIELFKQHLTRMGYEIRAT